MKQKITLKTAATATSSPTTIRKSFTKNITSSVDFFPSKSLQRKSSLPILTETKHTESKKFSDLHQSEQFVLELPDEQLIQIQRNTIMNLQMQAQVHKQKYDALLRNFDQVTVHQKQLVDQHTMLKQKYEDLRNQTFMDPRSLTARVQSASSLNLRRTESGVRDRVTPYLKFEKATQTQQKYRLLNLSDKEDILIFYAGHDPKTSKKKNLVSMSTQCDYKFLYPTFEQVQDKLKYQQSLSHSQALKLKEFKSQITTLKKENQQLKEQGQNQEAKIIQLKQEQQVLHNTLQIEQKQKFQPNMQDKSIKNRAEHQQLFSDKSIEKVVPHTSDQFYYQNSDRVIASASSIQFQQTQDQVQDEDSYRIPLIEKLRRKDLSHQLELQTLELQLQHLVKRVLALGLVGKTLSEAIARKNDENIKLKAESLLKKQKQNWNSKAFEDSRRTIEDLQRKNCELLRSVNHLKEINETLKIENEDKLRRFNEVIELSTQYKDAFQNEKLYYKTLSCTLKQDIEKNEIHIKGLQQTIEKLNETSQMEHEKYRKEYLYIFQINEQLLNQVDEIQRVSKEEKSRLIDINNDLTEKLSQKSKVVQENLMERIDSWKNQKNQVKSIIEQVKLLESHLSCLACDNVKLDMLMAPCGHNICQACIQEHSAMNMENEIKCEICNIKTKMMFLVGSLPHKSISKQFILLRNSVKVDND